MSAVMSRHAKVNRVWTMPVLLGTASLAGLALALIGDGTADAISIALLALPACVGIWFGYLRRGTGPASCRAKDSSGKIPER